VIVHPTRPASDGGSPISRHRVAVHGRWVDIWVTAADCSSLSVAGSRLAERLAADVLGVARSSLRVAPLAPSGRPVVVCAASAGDCGISISHLRPRLADAPSSGRGLVAVAACRGAQVGIDLVVPAEVSTASLSRFLATTRTGTDADARDAVRLWAAKEAAYKAAALDEAFRPRRIVVERVSASGFRWSVDGRYHAVHGAGIFVAEEGHILAVAVADHIPSLSHGAPPRP